MSVTFHAEDEHDWQLLTLNEESPDYWINNNVHRSSPVRFNAPALVRQVAYWYNEDAEAERVKAENAEAESSVRDASERLKNKPTRDYLDFIIIDVYRTVRENFGHHSTGAGDRKQITLRPCIENTILLFGKAVDENCNIVGKLTGRQSDIFFNEYRSVTIQFPWYDVGVVTARFELYTEYFTAFVCIDLENSVAKTLAEAPVPDVEAALDYLASLIRRTIHIPEPQIPERSKQFFYKTFWDIFAEDLLASDRVKEYRGHQLMKRMFADFRGLILSNELLRFPHANLDKPTWGSDAARQLLPLISELNRYECTASYMLDGRVLYISALGPQAPDISDDERAPVTYVLYVHQRTIQALFEPKRVVSRWQLGRLVDRIHLLGIMRLAALRDLGALHQAGESLARLEHLLKEARKAEVREEKSTLNLIRKAQAHFNSIGSTYFEKTNLSTGLMYRVERSRYYVTQFRANVPALRLSRLEGYQKYDQFVERRLGASYDFIDRLGHRYERASNALQTVYLETLTDRSYKTGGEIERLQRGGEAVLLGVLVPYYIVGSMGHLVGHKLMGAPGEENPLTQILSLLALSLGPGIAVFRWQPKEDNIYKRIWYGALFFLIAAIFWGVVYNNPKIPPVTSALDWVHTQVVNWTASHQGGKQPEEQEPKQ